MKFKNYLFALSVLMTVPLMGCGTSSDKSSFEENNTSISGGTILSRGMAGPATGSVTNQANGTFDN